MFIHPFWCGFISCIIAELILVVGTALILSTKDKDKKKGDDK